jgi:hypothetical protein
MELLQDILLNKIIIVSSLSVLLLFISRWALVTLREYMGYGLGWLLGIFFIIVYISLGGGQNAVSDVPQYLNIFQVFLATLLGLVFGSLIQLGLRFGMRMAQGVALQVALYTCLSIIVVFLSLMEGPIAHRMVGIFALAVGIATLFGMVLFPAPKREQQVRAMSYSQPIATPQEQLQQPPVQYPQDLGQGGGLPAQPMSRLDEIRQRQRLGNGTNGRR